MSVKPTIKSLTETLAIAQTEIARLHEALRIQAARAFTAEEELANLKEQLEKEAAQRANHTPTPESWKELSKKQLNWLQKEGCSFVKTAGGFKLFLAGEALVYKGKIASALKGKVCKDNSATWIYFS